MHTDKREQIIAAAIDFFALKGFDGSSIREIAHAAGVNIAMINYYFGSKEKLFEQIILQKAAAFKAVTDEIIGNPQLDYKEKVAQLLVGYVERQFHNRKFHRLVHQEMMLSNHADLQNTIVTLLSPNSTVIRDLIREGIEKGAFKTVDADLVVATFFGTVNYLISSRKFCNKLLSRSDDYDPYEDDAFRQRVKNHLLQMVVHYLEK